MKKQMKAVWAVLIMATIWLTINSSKINRYADEQSEIDAVVQRMLNELEESHAAKQLQEDALQSDATFRETFKEMRRLYGAGHIFEWNGREYTTDYLSETRDYSTAVSGGWVLNGNDPDDWCATNDRDECGECGGDGATEWYADRDGDGLGDSATIKLSCEEPSAFNE